MNKQLHLNLIGNLFLHFQLLKKRFSEVLYGYHLNFYILNFQILVSVKLQQFFFFKKKTMESNKPCIFILSACALWRICITISACADQLVLFRLVTFFWIVTLIIGMGNQSVYRKHDFLYSNFLCCANYFNETNNDYSKFNFIKLFHCNKLA